MNLFERINFLSLVVISSIVTSCNHSDSPTEPDDKQVDIESELDPTVEPQIDSKVDSVNCLNDSFIENLETGWESGYKDPRLAMNGFSYESSRNIKNGKERIFKNYQFGTELRISKVEYPDGETFFSVIYQVTPEQLQCFEESLNNFPHFQLKI